MPCHVEEIPANSAKKEIDLVVSVVNGKIKILPIGDSFHGEYKTLGQLLATYRKKYKTFQYRRNGTMLVIVSPCPKGC